MPGAPVWPSDGGEMGERVRAHPWSRTPLGPVDSWPPELLSTVGIILGARSAMAVYWGPDHLLLYNDPWRRLIGEKHPGALGRPARDVFPEVWETVGSILDGVLSGGGAVEHRNEPFALERGASGDTDETWFDFTMNPIPLADGSIGGILNVAVETTERHRAEAALRSSEARYRLLFENMDEGFALAEMIWDERGEPVDWRYLEVNGAWAQTGVPVQETVGRTAREVNPEIEPHWIHAYGRVVRTGEPVRSENHAAGFNRWFETFAFRHSENRFALLFRDVTERRNAEERQAFLVRLGDALRPLADPQAVQAAAARLLGEHLGASRVHYTELTADAAHGVVTRDYTAGVPSVVGRHRLDEYGPAVFDAVRAGLTVVVDDVWTDGRLTDTQRSRTAELGALGAYVVVPLHKDGRTVALLVAHHPEAHAWTDDEVFLVEETAERTWAAVERARAEAARAESEATYRALFESIDASYAVSEVIRDEHGHAVDLRFVQANRAFRTLGFGDPVGKRARQLLPRVDPEWLDTVGAIARSGEPRRWTSEALSLGRWYENYGYRFGRPEDDRVAVLSRDVTAQKRADERLRDSEARQGFLVRLNDALRPLAEPEAIQTEACRLLGEHLGVDRAYYVEADEAAGLARVHKNYLRSDSPSLVGVFALVEVGWSLPHLRRGEAVVVSDARSDALVPASDRGWMADLRTLAVVSVPVRKEGELRGALCVTEPAPRRWTVAEVGLVEDTAERIWAAIEQARAREALRASEERLRAFLGQLPLAAGLIQRDGAWIFRNPPMERLTAGGAPCPDARQGELWTPAEDGSRGDPYPSDWPVARALRGEYVPGTLIREAIDDGPSRWLLVSATPMVDTDAVVTGAVVIADDITQRIGYEQQLRDAKEEAEEANRVKSQFLSTMSHELRTPLNAVVGLTELMEMDVLGPTTDRQKASLARIRRASWHLTQIIDEILTFARSEAGKETIEREDVGLCDVARDVVDFLAPAAETEGVRLRFEEPAAPLQLETDRGKVAQILTNLTGNAVKFARSQVDIEVRHASDGTAAVLVHDDGPGIPADRLEAIFDPFTQLDSSWTRQAEGTGLGLTIARRHARLLGGDIEVRSRVGEGSTFTLRLPGGLPVAQV